MDETLIQFATQHEGFTHHTVTTPVYAHEFPADVERSLTRGVQLPTDIGVIEWGAAMHRGQFYQDWWQLTGQTLFDPC